MTSPLSNRTVAAIRRAVERLVDGAPGIPMAELVKLGQTAEVGLELDLESARRIGIPILVLRRSVSRPGSPFSALTRREREVAALVARGKRNRQIARELHISEATVKDHVHHALRKLGLASRT